MRAEFFNLFNWTNFAKSCHKKAQKAQKVVHIASYAIGSPLIGKLNDLLGAATNPGVMRYGFLVSPISCIFASVLLWRGGKLLEKIRE